MSKLIIAKSNRGAPDPIGLHDANGDIINPATVEKLDELKTILQQIDDNTDTLEIKAENINLNTDTLESKLQDIQDNLGSISGYTAIQGISNIEDELQSLNTKVDVELSTRASEVTVTEIKETIGQESGITVLSRLKDLWDKLHDLFTNGTGKIKLWDGTNQAGVDSQNHVYVSGKSATGSLPSANPVSVSGIDGNGLKRSVLTDSLGRIQVVTPISAFTNNIVVQLTIEKSLTAVNTGEWQEVLEYTVPTGYDLNCVEFDGFSSFSNERIKAIYKTILGSFICSTNTFTDEDSISAPSFDSKLYLYVTQAIGAGANDVITVTYVNQEGISGRTATVTVPKNSLVGTRLEVPLQTGDYGITDITNVTHSQLGQAGAFVLEGNVGLFHLVLTSANTQYIAPTPSLGSIVIPETGQIYLQYYAGTAVANTRRINLTGTLVPRG